MIKSEQEYEITKHWAEKFTHSIAALAAQAADGSLEPQVYRVLSEAEQSQLDELREQIAEYEGRRDGRLTRVPIDTLDQLPWRLIEARKLAGISKENLAAQLGLSPQQIQEDEAAAYETVSLVRLMEVLHALGIRGRGELIVPVCDSEPALTG